MNYGGADVASVAAALASPARTTMLDLLLDGRAHPAGELAREAGVAPSTASAHLSALVAAHLIEVEAIGRQRRYRMAGTAVARALEALAALAPARPVSSLAQATALERLRAGRTCYDHLAGRLGVTVTDALVARRALRPQGAGFELTAAGRRRLEDLGVDVEGALRLRRGLALGCLDWTERRVHLGGALGAALCRRWFDLGWLQRARNGRAVSITPAGIRGLEAELGVQPAGP